MSVKTLLKVCNLTVTDVSETPSHQIIKDVNFSILPSSILALVGESGSGKTTLGRALTRLISPHSRLRTQGVIQFGNVDLLKCDDDVLRRIRQRQIRYVFQEPQQALNPVLKIRRQMGFASDVESLATDELTSILDSVGVSNTGEVLDSYPHQLSIGMAQRVMIAMAILPQPTLLIADEPTSAVDASLRYQLLDLLKSLQTQNQMAVILITHDLIVAQRYANNVAVMEEGKIVEYASTKDFFGNPRHPYSRRLLDAIPHVNKRVSLATDFSSSNNT